MALAERLCKSGYPFPPGRYALAKLCGTQTPYQIDQETGGYNLESAKANEKRLNNLILLIAISYTMNSFTGQKIKNQGIQEYISRTNEQGRKERRHSSFWLGLSCIAWAVSDDFLWKLVENLMMLNSHKFLYYRRGIKAINTLLNKGVISG